MYLWRDRPQVALVAGRHNLLTILNAMLTHHTPWRCPPQRPLDFQDDCSTVYSHCHLLGPRGRGADDNRILTLRSRSLYAGTEEMRDDCIMDT